MRTFQTVGDLIACGEQFKSDQWVGASSSDPTLAAENELLGAASSIEAASVKLAQLKPRDVPTIGVSLFSSFSFSGCRFPVQLSKIHGCCPLSFCLNDLVETVSSGSNNERHLADYLLFLNIIIHAATFAGLIC